MVVPGPFGGPTMYFQQCVNYGKTLLPAFFTCSAAGLELLGVFSRLFCLDRPLSQL